MSFGVSWCDFRRSCALLTGSWGLLRPSWSLLGRSAEPLGALLGMSWSLLGVPWAVLKAIQNNIKITCKKEPILNHTATFIGSPKGSQNRPQMAPKTHPNFRRFSRAKKLFFKSLLEPSWTDLEPFWEPSWGSKYRCGIGRRSVS